MELACPLCQDIGMEFGIEKCAMLITRSVKRQMTEGRERINQEKNQKARRKGKLLILGNIEADTVKQAKMKEKKIKKEYLRRTRKQLETKLSQKPYRRGKHLGYTPCKIVGTILKEDEGRTLTNGAENKTNL